LFVVAYLALIRFAGPNYYCELAIAQQPATRKLEGMTSASPVCTGLILHACAYEMESDVENKTKYFYYTQSMVDMSVHTAITAALHV